MKTPHSLLACGHHCHRFLVQAFLGLFLSFLGGQLRRLIFRRRFGLAEVTEVTEVSRGTGNALWAALFMYRNSHSKLDDLWGTSPHDLGNLHKWWVLWVSSLSWGCFLSATERRDGRGWMERQGGALLPYVSKKTVSSFCSDSSNWAAQVWWKQWVLQNCEKTVRCPFLSLPEIIHNAKAHDLKATSPR